MRSNNHQMPESLLVKPQKRLLNRWLKKERNNTLLEVGSFFDVNWVEQDRLMVLRARDHIDLCHRDRPCVMVDYTRLPIQQESVDIVVLSHVLTTNHMLPILQEACYALKPNGQLIILGLNRFGVWRLCELLGFRQSFLEKRHFLSSKKIKTVLCHLGLTVVHYQTVCFRPPVKNKKIANGLFFLEMLGPMCFPAVGAGFMLVARKQVPGTTVMPVLEGIRANWNVSPVRQTSRSTV